MRLSTPYENTSRGKYLRQLNNYLTHVLDHLMSRNIARLKIKSDIYSPYRLYSLLLADSLDFKNKKSMRLRTFNLPILYTIYR